MVGARSAARPAVKEHHRLAVGIAAELPIKPVAIADVEHPGLVGLDLGIESAAGFHGHVHQKLNSS